LGKLADHWKPFKNLKQRGEWVELLFMAQAAQRSMSLSRPWGDNWPYDVGIENGPTFLRVQVKSTSSRHRYGYWCQFVPHYQKKQDYNLEQIDLFAAYVIPVNAWYLIPASVLLGRQRKRAVMLFPLTRPRRRNCYLYECYREAWEMLKKSREELRAYGQ
jgi:hypothetical protein